MTMTLVSTSTLTSNGSGFTFTNVPSSGTDLYIVLSTRAPDSTYLTANIWFNDAPGTGNNGRFLAGSGSAVSSESTTGLDIFDITPANATANTFGNTAIYVPNYRSTTVKIASLESVTENNATAAKQRIMAVMRNMTDPITQVDINGNFATGSSCSLYLITKGSGGATVS